MVKDSKKIAVVVPKYGLVGGGEGFAAELTVRLAEVPGYDIHVFVNKWVSNSAKITFHKIPIITFPKWLTTISFAWYANKKIEDIGGFDLIHTHERIFKADICSMHFIPHRFWVEEIRKKRILSLFDRMTIWVEKKMLSVKGGCKYVLPVSTLAAERLSEEYPDGKFELQVVHPGVKDSFFQGGAKERKKIREEFGVNPDDFLLLFVSMNFELKGLDSLLVAMSKVCGINSNRSLKLLVVGKGNEQKYNTMAKSLGLEGRIIFSGVRQDMPDIYRGVDLFVLLSGFDTFAMVVTEALAVGVPVLVSSQVGAKDFVKDGKNGFILDATDHDDLASRMTYLASNEKIHQKMSENASASVLDQKWDKVAHETNKFYKKFWRKRKEG